MPRVRPTSEQLALIEAKKAAALADKYIPDDMMGQALWGDSKSNTLSGPGKTVFFGGQGNDKIIGSAGSIDTAVFKYSVNNYRITTNADGSISVRARNSNEGTDTLTSVEQLVFGGKTYSVEPTTAGAAAKVTLLSGTPAPVPVNGTPTITSSSTATAINENVAAGQVVYTATSTDSGNILAGATSYSLKANTGDVSAFTINPTTGAVSLTGSPNFEAKSSYSFTVVATDPDGNKSEKAVNLAVKNLDEVAPTITSSATAAAIDENVAAGQVVYTATSTDTGDIATGSTLYSLKANTGDVAAFTINPTTGAVTLTGSPDFEAKPSYSFTVVATDAAGNKSEKAVSLAVNNLDEAGQPAVVTATINENTPPGTVVFTPEETTAAPLALARTVSLAATAAVASSTTYSLKAGVGDVAAFNIDPATGAVTLKTAPNYEAKSSYTFTVVQTDAAGNTSEKIVKLAVKNVDEVAPTITSGATAAVINENIPAGKVVYTATSTDTADISTGATSYSLKAGVGDVSAFTINSTTGAVTLAGSPNFEAKASYNFTVVATDAAGNKSEQAVNLAVKNLDESAPTITSSATATAINENVAPGQVVYTATSTDTGDTATGATTYSLKANTGDVSAFTINPTTGAVTLTGSPDFEAKPSYSFTVLATDAAGNQSAKAVSLAINNLAETAPGGGGTTTPPPATTTGDLPSFSLQNTSGAAEAAGYVSFGQVFAKGAIMPGQGLVAKINGQDVAVQMDVKTTNSDGSVDHAILTLKAPALATGASVSGTFAKGTATTSTDIQAQDILTKGFNFKVDVTLHNADGSTTVKTIDAAQALQQAITNGSLETWMKGSQASEFRVQANVAPNLDVKFDIRMDALGQTHTDVIFARDDAFSTNVGTLNYDVKFIQSGQTVFTDTNIQQHAYSTWHQEVSSSGVIDPHVVYDMVYLMKTGSIPSYDTSIAINTSTISGLTQALAQSDTGPMGNALVSQYMPGTGGRSDIGPETTWSATYLASQSAEAFKVMLANADAAGSVPWHLMDTNGDPLRQDLHPQLWVDGRGFGWSDSLPVAYNAGGGWDIDPAHGPSLTDVPYLLTGSHYYIDELQAQASYDIMSMNPTYSNSAGIITDNYQVRQIAWGLRDIANAAYYTPDGDPMKAYFNNILDANLNYWITNYVNGAKGDAQGQLEGMIGGAYGDGLRMAPWQQDYLATVLGMIAERGNDKAATILGWMDNFLSGRFINEAAGFDPLKGSAYNLSTIDPATGKMYTTWAQMYQATFGSNPPAGMADGSYPDWAGGYAANAKAGLASIISVTQSANAIEALGFLESQTTAMLPSYATDPTWDIAPQLANGQYLTHDEIFVASSTSGATMTAGANEQMLIGNIGNDTIVGGSGIGLLFGMDGNDTIRAGSGNSNLYGGDGNDRLVDGTGSNYFKGGAGADVFSFITANGGHDKINDFTKGVDRIEIQSNLNGSGIFTAADVISKATADTSGYAVLHLGTSHDIVLQGVMLNQLTSDIFTIV